MTKRRLMAMILAAVLTVSCIPCGWAEDALPQPEQDQPSQGGPSGGDVAAAVVSDILYIPGKTVACVMSSALWTVAMALTLGMAHREAGDLVHDVCAGKWVLTGEEFMGPEDNI